jgi:hypothetical protein
MDPLNATSKQHKRVRVIHPRTRVMYSLTWIGLTFEGMFVVLGFSDVGKREYLPATIIALLLIGVTCLWTRRYYRNWMRAALVGILAIPATLALGYGLFILLIFVGCSGGGCSG